MLEKDVIKLENRIAVLQQQVNAHEMTIQKLIREIARLKAGQDSIVATIRRNG
jgi:cell division protein FtsB